MSMHGPDYGLTFGAWLIHSIYVYYVISLFTLIAAFFVMRKIAYINWKLIPVYSIPVCGASYLAILIACRTAGPSYPRYPIWQFGGDNYMEIQTLLTIFLVQSVIAYVCYAILLAIILKLNDAESYSEIRYGAAVMTVISASYIGLTTPNFLIALLVTAVVLSILMVLFRLPVYLASRQSMNNISR